QSGARSDVPLFGPAEEYRKSARLGIAHRHECLLGENECDGCRFGTSCFGPVEDSRCHEMRAGFLIKPAGDLDLSHLLTSWHEDAEVALDKQFLRPGGTDQIDPDSLRYCALAFGLDQTTAACVIDCEHSLACAFAEPRLQSYFRRVCSPDFELSVS